MQAYSAGFRMLQKRGFMQDSQEKTATAPTGGDKFLMDGHKLLWHLDRVNAWTRGERIPPLHIDLGITTGCNIGCSFCYGVLQGRTNAAERFDMPLAPLLRLMEDAKEIGVRSILFDGQGENSLNPALPAAIDRAREIGLSVALATNGTILRPDDVPVLLAGLTWLRVNLSAATPESYRRIHGADLFDRVIANVRTLVEEKRQSGSLTTIGLQMVLTKENLEDIVPLSRLGGELGVDYLVIKPCSDDPDGTLDAPVDEYLALDDVFREAVACSNGDYQVVVKANKLNNRGAKSFGACFGTRFIINISGDGSVFPCGHFFNIRQEEFCMGNILDQSLREVIASDRYWQVQERISSIDVNRECETNCRHYYVSGFLWQLKNPPPHLDFI